MINLRPDSINAVLTKTPTKRRQHLPLTIEDYGFRDQEKQFNAADGIRSAISDKIKSYSLF